MKIQLSGRRNPVAGYAVVSPEDADLNSLKWHTHSGGYASRFVGTRGKQVCILMHRLIVSRMIGRPLVRGEYTDHINGDRLDNRRENLRMVTNQANVQHRTRLNKNNASGYRGVHWSAACQKWTARIMHNRVGIHLGVFDTAEEADRVARRKRAELQFCE